jgi:V/A-type H+-transporting ATPase subunit I
MKKVTLLCMADRKDSTLTALRELGALHVTPVAPPLGPEIEAAERRVAEAQRCLAYWDRLAEKGAKKKPSTEKCTVDVGEVVQKMNDLGERLNARREKVATLERELFKLAPYGDFDPAAIRALRGKGVAVRLFEASAKREIVAPKGAVLQILSSDGIRVHFVLSGPSAVLMDEQPYEELALPEKSPAEIRAEIEDLKKQSDAIVQEMLLLEGDRAEVELHLRREQDELRFVQVRDGMTHADQFAYLQGFCPVDRIESIRSEAARQGWGLLIQEPGENELPPTLVKYPAFVKPIKTIFDFLQIHPGYREADISMVFLLFFSVFFGMLIGDAGYGLLMLGATIFARIKLSKAPQYPFTLFFILSFTNIAWGVITGNYFGIAKLPAPLAGLKIDWLSNTDNVMWLCFLIGSIHLTIAHVWNAVVHFPATKAFEQIGWIGVVWTMYFAANNMVLGRPFPGWGLIMFGLGVVLIVLFMTPIKDLKRDWILHVMLPLNMISCFVDLVSYVRLFAVGLASVSVASSFNDIAMQAGFGNVLSGAMAILILLLGHGLNIALCGLGILVHGIRLNTLEFSMHKGMTWSGVPYNPFRKNEQS